MMIVLILQKHTISFHLYFFQSYLHQTCFFSRRANPHSQLLNHNTRDTLENIASLKSAHSKAKFARQAKINPPTSSASFTAVSKTQWAKDVKKIAPMIVEKNHVHKYRCLPLHTISINFHFFTTHFLHYAALTAQ